MIIVTDLEGTLTAGATWRGFRSYLKNHGRQLTYNLFFAAHAPGIPLVQIGAISRQSYQSRWLADMLWLFRGADADEAERIMKWVVEQEMWPQRRADVLAEIEAHRKKGARIVVASGTYQPIVEEFARRIGAEALGTDLELSDGHLTGRQIGPMSVQAVKARRVQEHLGNSPIDLAYGDTESDADLLALAREAVAVYPNKALRRIAQARGWRIVEG